LDMAPLIWAPKGLPPSWTNALLSTHFRLADNSSRTSSLALRLRSVASEQRKRARKAQPSFS